MKKLINWIFQPTQKHIVEGHISFYEKLIELENRIEILERENVEQTNALYEVSNSLEARIDILLAESYSDKND